MIGFRAAFTAVLVCLFIGQTGIARGAIPEQRPWPSDGLVGHWDFTSGSTADKTGTWGDMTLTGGAYSSGSALQLRGSDVTASKHAAVSGYTGPELRSKTIVSRFKMVDRDAARMGSVGSLTSNNEDQFDAIEWEEHGENSFFLGSDFSYRTDSSQPFTWTHNNVELTIAVVMTQDGGSTKVQMYVDGFLRRDYTKASLQNFAGTGIKLLWGVRHIGQGAVSADVYETRLYNRALRESEIVQIVPVQESTAGNYFRARYINGHPTLTNARRMCRGNGLHLAQIRSAAESNEAHSIRGSVDYSLSGSDMASEGLWVWEDGPGAGVTFFTQSSKVCNQAWCNWNGNEPNDASGGQDFMRVYNSKKWDDYQDSLAPNNDWLCQRETREAESQFFKAYVKRQRMSLDYGLAFCAALGGHLATITTSAESQEVASILTVETEYLVAGSDTAVEGQWRWMAGKEKGQLISNGGSCVQSWCGWHGSEPNDSDVEDEMYVYTDGTALRWNDNRGTREWDFGMVCEFRPDTKTPELTDTKSLEPTASKEITPSETPSLTLSPPSTSTMSSTPSASSSSTRSWSASLSSSGSRSRSLSRSPSLTSSVSRSISLTASVKATESLSIAPTMSISLTNSTTTTLSATVHASVSESASLTLLPTRTPSTPLSASVSETITAAMTSTVSAVASPSATPSLTVVETASLSATMSSPQTLSVSVVASQSATATATHSTTATMEYFFSRFLGENAIEAKQIAGGEEQHLHLSIEGEAFDMLSVEQDKLNGNSTGKLAVPVHWCEAQNVGGPGASGCYACIAYENYNSTTEFVLENSTDLAARLFHFNTTMEVNSSWSAALIVSGAPWFGVVADDLHFTFDINPGCFGRRRPFPVLNFTLRRTPPKGGVPQEVIDASKDAATAAVLVGGMGSPAIAGQLSRSSIALTLSECEPERNEELDTSQHPLGMKLSDSDFSFYVGGAMLNHVVCLGFGMVLVAMGGIHSLVKGTSVQKGFEFSRFPSLLSFPLMFLIEPTSMCAVTAIIYASLGWQIAGGLSLALCTALPVILFWYLRRNRENFVFHPLWDTGDDKPPHMAEVFFFGRSKWTDIHGPHTTGFCQRNRLLYCDYRGEYYWFLCVEMVMSILCGSLDGVKLGFGQCNAIIIGLIVVFALFLLMLLVVRPYNAPFLQWFAVILTFLQLCSTICVALYVLADHEPAQEYAQWFSLCCMYLLMMRMVYDVGPKSYRWYKGLLKLVGLRKAKETPTLPPQPVLNAPGASTQNFNDELHRQLMDMLGEDSKSNASLDDVLGVGDGALLGDTRESLDDLLFGSPDDDSVFELPVDDDEEEVEGDESFSDVSTLAGGYAASPLGAAAAGQQHERQGIDLGAFDEDEHPDVVAMRHARALRERQQANSSGVLLASILEPMDTKSERWLILSGLLARMNTIQASLDATAAQSSYCESSPTEVLELLTDSELNQLSHQLEGVQNLQGAVLRKRVTETHNRKHVLTAAAALASFKHLSEAAISDNPNSTLGRLLMAGVSRAMLTQELEELPDPPNPIALAPTSELQTIHSLLVVSGTELALQVAQSIALQRPELQLSQTPALPRRGSTGLTAVDVDFDDQEEPPAAQPRRQSRRARARQGLAALTMLHSGADWATEEVSDDTDESDVSSVASGVASAERDGTADVPSSPPASRGEATPAAQTAHPDERSASRCTVDSLLLGTDAPPANPSSETVLARSNSDGDISLDSVCLGLDDRGDPGRCSNDADVELDLGDPQEPVIIDVDGHEPDGEELDENHPDFFLAP